MKIFSLIALLAATTASANEYYRYNVVCKISGSEQTMSSNRVDFPGVVQLRMSFVTTANRGEMFKLNYQLVSSLGYNLTELERNLKLKVTAEASCENGVGIELGALDNRLVRELLLGLGVTGAPQLDEGITDMGKIGSGRYYEGGYYGGCKDYPRRELLKQIHFPPERYDGLSYHFNNEGCAGTVINPNGEITRFGAHPAEVAPTKPTRRGD